LGQTLLKDDKFQTLLSRLDRNIEATQKEMAAIGVVNECADCAVNGEGSCCGARNTYKYDSILLLINLLLKKSLPSQPENKHMCYFLTRQGCSLRARHVICVNFLCPRLRENIQLKKLIRLQEIAGEELNTLFILEEYIKKKIASSPILFKTSHQGK
jgi:hypothetical protein